MAGLLLIEIWVAVRFVRRRAMPADRAITDADCKRAAADAADFLAGLTTSQRFQVSRSVLKGRAVADAALAAAATSAAHAAKMKARVSIGRPHVVAPLAAVFWGGLSASRLVTERGGVATFVNVIITVASVWLVQQIVAGPVRLAERASRAEQLNLALVARGASRTSTT